MKSRPLILIFSFLIISVAVFSQAISDKQITFANEFVAAVSDHSEKKTMKHLDKAYKKEQLAFHKGKNEQLVNKLFGGEDLSNSDKYLNFKISEITKIEIAEVIQLKGTSECTYIFRIKRGEQEIYSSLRLIVKGNKFGFEGPKR